MTGPVEALDIDVAAEQNRIRSGGAANDLIRLEGLTKVFPGKVAVNDVWFGIPAGECFGFLGVNGAGIQSRTTLKHAQSQSQANSTPVLACVCVYIVLMCGWCGVVVVRS